MTTDVISAIQLLHAASYGALSTSSVQMPGYPFATVLPFVVDEHHFPVFLISSLAEHTKNLNADSRASFLIAAGERGSVLREPRLTLVGDVTQFEPSAEMVARYVRYQPDARRYLQLSDFAFYRFAPKRARYIAGFGEMGWVDEDDWTSTTMLPLSDEDALFLEVAHPLPNGSRLLGIDCYGIDTERQGTRERHVMPNAPVAPDMLGLTLKRYIASL